MWRWGLGEMIRSWSWSPYEGGPCPIKRPHSTLFSLLLCAIIAIRWPFMNQKVGPHQILYLSVCWSWTLQPLKLWWIIFHCLQASCKVYVICCKSMVFVLQQPKCTKKMDDIAQLSIINPSFTGLYSSCYWFVSSVLINLHAAYYYCSKCNPWSGTYPWSICYCQWWQGACTRL